jgi:hypothetical protein
LTSKMSLQSFQQIKEWGNIMVQFLMRFILLKTSMWNQACQKLMF